MLIVSSLFLLMQLTPPPPTQAQSIPAQSAEAIVAVANHEAAETQEQKADAKEPPTPEHTGIRALFGNLGEDLKHLPSWPNVYIAAVGGGLALAVHPWDKEFNAHLQSGGDATDDFFAAGKYIGSTEVQIAFSVGTYAVGRWRDQPKVAHLGMDLLQAQILSEILVEPLKLATQRLRPYQTDHCGFNCSFPSGHASITFADATVILRHMGWRYSVAGYAIAAYVAASRLHDNDHWLSDVVFGSAMGTIAGRTVVHHASDYWALTPAPMPGGGVVILVSRTTVAR
jgi:membrane-associated phospholipid phosphatase